MTKFKLTKAVIIVGLFMMTFAFTNCSNDDDSYTDPVIGVWNLVSINGVKVSECAQKSEAIFSENGDYSVTGYAKGADGACAIQNTAKGVWKNKGKGIYSIQINGHSERETNPIFSNNNNTITFTSTVADGETTTTQTQVIKRKQ